MLFTCFICTTIIIILLFVYRHHLPQNHPDKPKDDWFSSTIARVTASVATEFATSLGYELSFFVSIYIIFYYLMFVLHVVDSLMLMINYYLIHECTHPWIKQ